MPTSAPVLDAISRRGLLTGLGAVSALTACGGTTAPAPATPASRTVDSRFGPVTVPVDPRRVVTTLLPDWALVLDLPLVGAEGEFGDAANPFAAYQIAAHPELAAATRVTTAPLDAERIAALAPDLILGAVDDDTYASLSRIAPTLGYTETTTVNGVADVPVWRAALREIGAALGRGPRAEEIVSAYEQRAADLRARLAARWSGARVAVVNPLTDHIGVFGRQTFTPDDVLTIDLGLTRSGAVRDEYRMLSLEQLGLIDADVLFVAVGSVPGSVDRDRAQLAPYTTSALWPRIPAVAAGQVHEFDRSLVYTSPLTASTFLDVVDAALLPGEPS